MSNLKIVKNIFLSFIALIFCAIPAMAVENSSVPTGSSSSAGSSNVLSDVFGGGAGYFHPFISLDTLYTDNYYNTKNDKKDEFTTIISPGIWIAFPGSRKQLMNVPTSPSSTGGMVYSRDYTERFERFQGYLSYRADVEKNSNHPKNDFTNHNAEGFLSFNLKSGLTFELLDKYVYTRDDPSSISIGEFDKYATNLVNALVKYDMNDRLILRADYSNFNVNYRDAVNDALDRVDNSYSAYVYLRVLPKTHMFTQYQYVDVKYDQDILANSKLHNGYVGLKWDATGKTTGSFKAGYSLRKFDKYRKINDKGALAFSGNVNYDYSSKTKMVVNISRSQKESNLGSTTGYIGTDAEFALTNNITKKLKWKFNLSYSNEDYDGEIAYDGGTKSRKDNYYGTGLSIGYSVFKWLDVNGGYNLTKRDSNFSELDYINNTIYLNCMIFM